MLLAASSKYLVSYQQETAPLQPSYSKELDDSPRDRRLYVGKTNVQRDLPVTHSSTRG